MDNALHALLRMNRLYLDASRLAKLGAWECDLDTEELTWTEGVYDIFDLPLGPTPKRNAILDLYDEESRAAMEDARARVIATGRAVELDTRIRTFAGEGRWMRLSIGITCENGRPVRVFGAKQDITAEKAAWDRLRRRADRDALTGLANRAVFDARYREVTVDRLNHGSVSALALFDIDHFKLVNDGLGHVAGDDFLRQIGSRLQRFFVGADLIARVGGDEFAVLLRAPLDLSEVSQILSRAQADLCKPVYCGRQRLVPSVSIGAAVLGRPHVRKLSGFFADADAALYAAKAAGRNTFRVFGEEPSGSRPTSGFAAAAAIRSVATISNSGASALLGRR